MMLVQCCFCGERVEPGNGDPVTLTVAVPDGGEQQLYCHWHHLKERLHSSVPLYLPERTKRD